MPDRVEALDVLRGVAILGTLASNVWLFTAPGGPAALLHGGIDTTGAVQTALVTLSNGKFLALLTLLFGIGLEIQYRSAVRRGVPWPGRYPVRAAILFVEGCCTTCWSSSSTCSWATRSPRCSSPTWSGAATGSCAPGSAASARRSRWRCSG
ncbi:hypothetical protein GCM10017691_55820 [Pseudonocardia petroleophila]|uniref:hypothetical protein n=1 Tax=Pseudonocardia petroleophila TaxID=37331 RepID=UPI0031E36D0C